MVIGKNVKKKFNLQFYLNSVGLVPKSAIRVELGDRGIFWVGEKDYAIKPTRKCSAEDFVRGLRREGFELRIPTWQCRSRKNDELYCAVKFQLYETGHADEAMSAVWEDLQGIVDGTLWEVWSYVRSNTINLGSRTLSFGLGAASYLYVLNKNIDVAVA